MNRPLPSPGHAAAPSERVRINGKIRAPEVRVMGPDGQELGIYPVPAALALAREHGVDLVEISPDAVPPVCRLVEIGLYRYEQAKRKRSP